MILRQLYYRYSSVCFLEPVFDPAMPITNDAAYGELYNAMTLRVIQLLLCIAVILAAQMPVLQFGAITHLKRTYASPRELECNGFPR